MEDKIKELYELIPEGYFNSEQELRDYITDENKLKEVYEFIPKDYFKDSNEYVSYFGETLKKKFLLKALLQKSLHLLQLVRSGY